MAHLTSAQKIGLTVFVAALGYFVDLFDVVLFSIVRISSLTSLGVPADQITATGTLLLNWQMAGFITGGILWGVLGDKKGRVYVLFGTILLYSLGTIANGFVTTIPEYAALRFLTAIGLAGEIGAGVSLLSELLPKEKRVYATSLMMASGLVAPVVASQIAGHFDWRITYIVGGVMGLFLLAARLSVNESKLFEKTQEDMDIPRGKFLMFFTNKKRFLLFLATIGMGVPVWFVPGVLIFFTPEIGVALGVTEPVKAGQAIIVAYSAGVFGCLLSGWSSQQVHSRKFVIGFFVVGIGILDLILLNAQGISSTVYYTLIGGLGFGMGYWTLLLTTTAELFGTNLRVTATSSVANFVRGSTLLSTFLIDVFKPDFGFLHSLIFVAIIGLALAFSSLWKLPETFGRDLDFIEK